MMNMMEDQDSDTPANSSIINSIQFIFISLLSLLIGRQEQQHDLRYFFQVEMENQEQQRILEESLAAGAELKEKCMVEQQELSRLKQIWSDTQPELFPGFAPKRMDTRRSS